MQLHKTNFCQTLVKLYEKNWNILLVNEYPLKNFSKRTSYSFQMQQKSQGTYWH